MAVGLPALASRPGAGGAHRLPAPSSAGIRSAGVEPGVGVVAWPVRRWHRCGLSLSGHALCDPAAAPRLFLASVLPVVDGAGGDLDPPGDPVGRNEWLRGAHVLLPSPRHPAGAGVTG